MNKISVKLTYKDWQDLAQFVVGDIHNMDEADDIKHQMRRICDTIYLELAKQPERSEG